MTDRELMQMALDALEGWDSLIQHQYNGTREAMSDLTACAQSTPPIIEALRAALAQPEQEPELYCYTWDKWISSGTWEAQYGWKPYYGGKRPEHSTEAKPLYTAPPQREWVGLTDEEQLEIMKQFGLGQRALFADAIEAKLKEKNT